MQSTLWTEHSESTPSFFIIAEMLKKTFLSHPTRTGSKCQRWRLNKDHALCVFVDVCLCIAKNTMNHHREAQKSQQKHVWSFQRENDVGRCTVIMFYMIDSATHQLCPDILHRTNTYSTSTQMPKWLTADGDGRRKWPGCREHGNTQLCWHLCRGEPSIQHSVRCYRIKCVNMNCYITEKAE